MKIYIRYMVSLRCKTNVKEALKKLGISAVIRELGTLELKKEIDADLHEKLRISLSKCGLVLLDKDHEEIIEKMKTILDQLMAEDEVFSKSTYEEYLIENLGLTFEQLSTIFAEVHGSTISNYLLILRIEKVKEMILYSDQKLKVIAHQLGFKNPGQLNRHFKKVTGLNPSYFVALKKKRHSLLAKVQ